MDVHDQILALKAPFLKEIPCLDKGFVKLESFEGCDQTIVRSARVSYGDGTKTVREDKALIDYLLRHAHTSPFEQVNFTFNIKLPIFVARQIVRHRTAKLNEISGRYSILKDEFYVPDISRMQTQSKDNKQGSSDTLIDNAENTILTMTQEQETAYDNYESYIESGMAKELARINLPVSTYSQWIWQCDLHNLFHFLRLRLDAHAQYEVRVYAEAKYELIKPIVPFACESFERHILNGRKFSSDEMALMKNMLNTEALTQLAIDANWKQSKIDELIKKL